jgi:hypothetical protein
MTNVNDNVRISDNIGVVASSSSKQLSSIRTLSLPFFILNILLFIPKYNKAIIFQNYDIHFE